MSDKIAIRLGWNDDDTLDEFVASDIAYVHLEQMAGTAYWMDITVDGRRHVIWFRSKSKIKVTHEEEPA